MPDLALIEAACKDLRLEFGREIEFEIIGVTADNAFAGWRRAFICLLQPHAPIPVLSTGASPRSGGILASRLVDDEFNSRNPLSRQWIMLPWV